MRFPRCGFLAFKHVANRLGLAGFLAFLALGQVFAEMPNLPPLKEASYVEYFSTLPFRESPFANVVGIHPITREEARNRNHYRFEYDARHRPIRITFMLGNTPRPTNHTANFFFRTTRMDISYEQGREVRTFFDRFGNPALARGVYKEIYEFDEAGYRKRLTFENADGTRAQSGWGIAEYRWRIDKDGTVIELHFNLEGDTVVKRPNLTFYTLRLHYGPHGWLSLMENYGPDGEALVNNTMNAAQDKLDYDANGDMRAWNVFDENRLRVRGNSPGVHKGLRDFNEYGHIVRTYYEDENGDRMGSAYGWGESTTSYDTFGNILERWTHTFDGSERAINERLQYSGWKREWDETGLLELSRRYFLADGKSPAIHANIGAHFIRFEYDDSGNRTRLLHYDAEGNLIPSLDFGAAIIEMDYDDKNRMIERRLLDADQNLVNHPDGWAIERVAYDQYGMRAMRQRFDKDGEPFEEAGQ